MDLNQYVFSIDMPRSNLCFKLCFLFNKRYTISDSWITRLQINLIARYKLYDSYDIIVSQVMKTNSMEMILKKKLIGLTTKFKLLTTDGDGGS
jgi:hypothetical protein